MAIDLFDLRAYTEEVGVDDLRLVHITGSGGGPAWGLMRRTRSGLDRWLALEAGTNDEAVRIIEAVGLMPLREERVDGDEEDAVFVLQPGSEHSPDETPV
jgi:hypothetical protein